MENYLVSLFVEKTIYFHRSHEWFRWIMYLPLLCLGMSVPSIIFSSGVFDTNNLVVLAAISFVEAFVFIYLVYELAPRGALFFVSLCFCLYIIGVMGEIFVYIYERSVISQEDHLFYHALLSAIGAGAGALLAFISCLKSRKLRKQKKEKGPLYPIFPEKTEQGDYYLPLPKDKEQRGFYLPPPSLK